MRPALEVGRKAAISSKTSLISRLGARHRVRYLFKKAHHAVADLRRVPEFRQIAPNRRGYVRCVPSLSRTVCARAAFLPLRLRPQETRSWGRGPKFETGTSASAGQTKHRSLASPFDRPIAQSCDANALRQPTLNGSLHNIRGNKGKRYGHVDLTRGASFALGDSFDARVRVINELVEPPASARNCGDQCRASLGPNWTGVLRLDPNRQENLPASR